MKNKDEKKIVNICGNREEEKAKKENSTKNKEKTPEKLN